jgi:hypothetical protein
MLQRLLKDKLTNQLSETIVNNCLFDAPIVYKKRAHPMRGIKLTFKDETGGMLWAFDKAKYIFNYKAFDSFIRIPITREQGDKIWEKFLFTFDSKYNYEDV